MKERNKIVKEAPTILIEGVFVPEILLKRFDLFIIYLDREKMKMDKLAHSTIPPIRRLNLLP